MLEGYITPLLMSYLDKYVKNIKPSDLKLSFWGGDAVLRNLELRLDVLERELKVPLDIKSGCIRELTLHIPWSSIASSPVEVTVKDLELIVRLKSPHNDSQQSPADSKIVPDKKPESLASLSAAGKPVITSASSDKEPPAPGYLQGYLNRIVHNVCVHVQNMVIKVTEESSDLMLTLNVGSVDFHTTSEKWEREYVYMDYFQEGYALYKVCEVKDVTVNLHPLEMREKAQGTLLHEPFVKRCSFVCRMKSEYQGKVFLRRTLEILIDVLEFSVDERQFCLFLHLLDWLLATYYSFKKLKGRDDNPYLSSEAKPDRQPVSYTDTAATQIEPIGSRDLDSGPGSSGNVTTAKAGAGTELVSESTSGWGSWFMSFVSIPEDEEESSVGKGGGGTQLTQQQGREGEGNVVIPKETDQTKTRFCITAKSVSIVFNMTQCMQTPVFFSSFRTFISPVIKVDFRGCMFSLDKCSCSNLFLVAVGIESVEAEIMGPCPCVRKYPSSWRRTSLTSLTDNSECVS